MAKTILIIGTLDTKTKDLSYLRAKIEAENAAALIMDVSCQTDASAGVADISCTTVAEASGKSFSEVAGLDKNSAGRLMAEGAIKIAKRLLAEGSIHGIIGLGGGNCAEIACSVMRSLPIGFPKLMVTCVASGNVRPYVGTKDIMMANSIGDISLNRITKRVIQNSARAIAHMAVEQQPQEVDLKPQICMSTFGTTLACVEQARNLLEKSGYEVIELHASGTGGMALEELVKSGEINGVLDITTSELVDDLIDGMYSAGPNRLEAAGAMGIPQVISTGALDFGNFGPKETIPSQYRDRNFFFYTPSISLMRTNVAENRIIGETLAKKANAAKGLSAVIIPERGFSVLDQSGGKQMTKIDGTPAGEWYDKKANTALIESIRNHLDTSRIQLKLVDAHINDPEFAKAAVDLLISLMNIR